MLDVYSTTKPNSTLQFTAAIAAATERCVRQTEQIKPVVSTIESDSRMSLTDIRRAKSILLTSSKRREMSKPSRTKPRKFTRRIWCSRSSEIVELMRTPESEVSRKTKIESGRIAVFYPFKTSIRSKKIDVRLFGV